LLVGSLVLLAGASCNARLAVHGAAATQAAASGGAGNAGVVADIDPQDLRDTLAGLARAHSQKTQLAFWISTPLRPVAAPFKTFFSNMGKTQGELLDMLKKWAREHKVDLTFHFSNDTAGKAQQVMEAREEKLVRGDSQADFERDILMQMYTDFDWQISQLQVLLPKVKDGELKTYLEKSLEVHEEGLKEIQRLLKSFKFAVK
jgi:hypothetical protein